jgi:prevent-host-death family protein
MTTITSKDAQNRFGHLLDTVKKEPVTITKNARPAAVVLSPERYAELEALEESLWLRRAREAVRNGFASTEESMEFIERTLNAAS